MKLFTHKIFGGNTGESDKFDLRDLRDLRKISEENAKDTKAFLEHRVTYANEEIRNLKANSNLDLESLKRVILNPDIDPLVQDPYDLSELIKGEKYEGDDLYDDNSKNKLRTVIRELEKKKQEEIEKNSLLNIHHSSASELRQKNIYLINDIDDGNLEGKLRNSNIRRVLLVSDTFFTRNSFLYRKIISILERCELSFVEYTNVQPNLDRRVVFKMAEFAHDHEVNALLVVGSSSTIDFVKVVLPKIVRPDLIRLNKNLNSKALIADKYYVFTVPTIVVPEEGFNSRSAVRNNIIFSNVDFFGDTIFLNNLYDDSDAIFYCTEVFNLLSKEKVIELLHETFFRLFINYFDLSATPEDLDSTLISMKSIERYLDIVTFGQELDIYEQQEILRIVSTTLDGHMIVDVPDFWIWYKLESSLSLLTNSKKSDGLALFLPTYLEIMSQHSIEFNKRAIDLSTNLYGSYSVEGLIFKLIMRTKKYKLPMSFLDIPEIKKLDYKFLSLLVKKASYGTFFNKLTKLIIKNLTIW